MEPQASDLDLGIDARLRRTRNRPGRRTVVSTKVTPAEQEQMEAVAKADGKVVSEWVREVLLRESNGALTQTAIFTELMALRLLMNGVLREIALGRTMSPDQYSALLREVRNSKRTTARDVLAEQYEPQPTGGQ